MDAEAKIFYDEIPTVLKERLQWICWLGIDNGKGHLDKIPVSVITRRNASHSNPSCWASYNDAVDFHFQKIQVEANIGDGTAQRTIEQAPTGIGFVFSKDDPFVGIDLDNCRNPETKIIDQWAIHLLDLCNTYSEVSPSGKGVKMWLKGNMPGGKGRRNDHYQTGGVEIYPHNRFFTVTGDRIGDAPKTITDNSDAIAQLCEIVFPPKEESQEKDAPKAEVTQDDHSLIRKALNAKNGERFRALWAGDSSDYAHEDGSPDDSRADLALCSYLAFWTQCNPERIDRLFRKSGLFRDKWERADYRDSTIAKSIEGSASYNPNYNRAPPTSDMPPMGDPPTNGSGQPPEFLRTDGGNAKRLIHMFGENLRYIPEWKSWFVWDKTRFQRDRQLLIDQVAKRTTQSMLQEAAQEPDLARQDVLMKHALRSDSSARYKSMIELARSEPGIPLKVEQLDSHNMLLNCQNGTVDLKTGKLLPHDKKHLITKCVNASYSPDASCPFFLESLNLWQADDAEMVEFLQRAVGYSLTGSMSEQILFILHGSGENGKSAFLEAILHLFGDYGGPSEPEMLVQKRQETHPTGIADLVGRRFVSTTEIGEGVRLNEALVKRLTGSDEVKARFMHQDFFEFKPTHKLWVAVNHKPNIKGTDRALWRRIRLIPFEAIIPDEKKMRFDDLVGRYQNESDGILRWAVDGCLKWQKDGLGLPAGVQAATDAYRSEMDSIGTFIEDCCMTGILYKTRATQLYTAYREWAETSGERPMAQRTFGMKLTERGIERYTSGGYKSYKGLGLREDPDVGEGLEETDDDDYIKI